jgi:glycosyltransferase involved in cell wall biosynthesis
MKKIKVVHLSNIDVGLKIHLGNYMSYLQDQGFEVSAISHPGHWLQGDTTIFNGIRVKIIPFEPRYSPVKDFISLMSLVNFFNKERFDIVHTHAVKPGLLGRIAARISGIPIIVHTVHGFYFYPGMSTAQYRLFVMVEKLGALCCDLILSQNKEDIDTAVRENICPPEKIHYLGNGINLSRYDPDNIDRGYLRILREKLGISKQEVIIGFVARIVREKGIYEFFEAIKILKSKGIRAKYLIVGTPQINKKTTVTPEKLVRDFNIQKDVLLLGYREDIPDLLSLMDIVVMPSHGREGIPRILMESAALGKPVVATLVRGNKEIVQDQVTGLLVPPFDGPALANGILRLILNPQDARVIGENARIYALDNFDERHFFHKTDIEYRCLINERLHLDTDMLLKPISMPK